jgi:acyl-CoA synthetase (AMP-forming)/AMP-acid ligase II
VTRAKHHSGLALGLLAASRATLTFVFAVHEHTLKGHLRFGMPTRWTSGLNPPQFLFCVRAAFCSCIVTSNPSLLYGSILLTLCLASPTIDTSGSTGAPKGAVVTGAAFFAEVHPFVTTRKDYDGSGVGLIGELPLSHTLAFESGRCVPTDSPHPHLCVDAPLSVSATPYNLCAEILNGGRTAVYRTLTRVFEIAKHIAPNSLGLVPQLWAVLFKQYTEELAARIASESRTRVGDLGALEQEVTAALDTEYRGRLGHRVRGLNCGGATPMPSVQAWLKRVFTQCYVTENYASTEAGPITTTIDGDTIAGAGRIAEGIIVKLVDCGECVTTVTRSSSISSCRGRSLVTAQHGSSHLLPTTLLRVRCRLT